MVGPDTSTARQISTARARLGDILTAYCLGVRPEWLDAMEEAEPDGGVRGRLDVLVDAVDLAGPDEWLLRAWLIGCEPGDDSPATLIRAGELGAVRADARRVLDEPGRVVTRPLARAKAALEEIERSGLTGLGWLAPHLDALRGLVAEHERLLRRFA